MNIKDAIMEFAIFEPMTVRDLSGKVREEVIQINMIEFVPRIEKAVRKVMVESKEIEGYNDYMDTFIKELVKT